jgi:hypothetical protein
MSMMTAAGLIALGLMMLGRAGFAVGGILFITANIAGGIFIGSYGISQERKDQSHLFALSLPVSVLHLHLLKLATALLTFLVPWLLLTTAACSLALLDDGIPDGIVVYTLMVQGCALTFVCAYFAVISTSRSEGLAGFAILTMNMGFTLFMVSMGQPALRDPVSTANVVWPGYALLTLAVQLLVIVVSLLLALFVMSRRRDYF